VRWRGTLRSIDGIGLVTPSPTDRVLHNFLHAEIHHLGHYYRGEMQVAQAYELAMLAGSFGSAIDWRFIERRVQTHRLAASLRAYLVTAQRLFGLAWPLAAPPDAPSRLHYFRCRLQAQARPLQWLGVTWGNLRGPLAWHRMHALYGSDGSALTRRYRHVAQFLRKKGALAGVARLRRSE
jgi:hypothetical protein